MSQFKYSDEEKELNRVLKLNQIQAQALRSDRELAAMRSSADSNIDSSMALLQSLGYGARVDQVRRKVAEQAGSYRFNNHPQIADWNDLVAEANQFIPEEVVLEDLLTPEEIESAFRELESIEAEFSRKTSIINKTDLSFLAVATGLQVAKSLIFPLIAEKFGYGDSFDPSERLHCRVWRSRLL